MKQHELHIKKQVESSKKQLRKVDQVKEKQKQQNRLEMRNALNTMRELSEKDLKVAEKVKELKEQTYRDIQENIEVQKQKREKAQQFIMEEHKRSLASITSELDMFNQKHKEREINRNMLNDQRLNEIRDKNQRSYEKFVNYNKKFTETQINNRLNYEKNEIQVATRLLKRSLKKEKELEANRNKNEDMFAMLS